MNEVSYRFPRFLCAGLPRGVESWPLMVAFLLQGSRNGSLSPTPPLEFKAGNSQARPAHVSVHLAT